MIYFQRCVMPAPFHGSRFLERWVPGMSVELANLALGLAVPVRARDYSWMNDR